MKQTSASTKSKTDWARLANPAKAGTPTAEHPQADVKPIVRGGVRKGLQPAPSNRTACGRDCPEFAQLRPLIAAYEAGKR